MDVDVRSYRVITEDNVIKALRESYQSAGEETIFIVPAGLDKEVLLNVICGSEPFFSGRPLIWTLGDMLRELLKLTGERVRVIDPPDHKLILRCLLKDFLDEMDHAGVPIAQGVSHRGFVSVLGDNIKDLLAEEVSPENLAGALFNEGKPDPSRPESILISLYRKYIDYLALHRLADAAQIPSLICGELSKCEVRSFLSRRPLTVIGFLSFNGAQLRLMRALGGVAKRMLMLQPETGLDDFHDGIKQLNFEYRERPKWNLPVVELEASNEHLELEAVAREIALWLKGEGAFQKLGGLESLGDVGIMVGTGRMQVMEYALSKYKIAYNIQARGTVGDTAAGELPSVIWRAWSSGWGNYDTSALLSNVLLFPASEAEYDTSLFPDSYDLWQNSLEFKSAKEKLTDIRSLCIALEKGGTPKDILTLWRDFLKKVDIVKNAASLASDDASLDDVVKDTAFSIDELEKKIRGFKDGSIDVGAAVDVVLRGSDAVSFIREWGETATLPIQFPQSRSLTLYAGAPATLVSHRFWIMTDVDYNSWPGPMHESMLLPNDSKIKFNSAPQESYGDGRFHIPDIREERERKEAVFRRLAATGEQGIVTARALHDSSGDAVGESPFAAGIVDGTDAARRWHVVGRVSYMLEDAMPDGSGLWFPQAEVVCTPVSPGRSEQHPEGRSKPAQKPVVRVSDIDTWNSCPYLYWCTCILKFDKPRSGLYDPRSAGILLHHVWEESLNSKLAGGSNSIQGYVLSNWRSFKERFYPELDTDPRMLLSEEKLARQIFDMAGVQDEIESRVAAAGRSSVDMELALEEFEMDGVTFRGQADRVDWYGNAAVVIDYKLGRSTAHLGELQVPAYCAMLNISRKAVIKGFGWFCNGDCTVAGYFDEEYYGIYASGIKQKSKTTPQDRMEEAVEVMKAMAESVKNGLYVPKYDENDMKCKMCNFYTICRKRENRRYIDSLSEDEREGTSYE